MNFFTVIYNYCVLSTAKKASYKDEAFKLGVILFQPSGGKRINKPDGGSE